MKPERRERIRRLREFMRRNVWLLWGLALLECVLASILAARGHPWIGALYVHGLLETLYTIAWVSL